eukprot:TRINITY_DN3339_c0_g1_i7.p1 TRINITY_DN3339_c0_g1~~TRINITY_DN3339_c0_g1_i7.p1  ORF type:complete len:262 (+),score=-23.13 TRINITY_DN3339_c0_g1_i7:501-1286(+)
MLILYQLLYSIQGNNVIYKYLLLYIYTQLHNTKINNNLFINNSMTNQLYIIFSNSTLPISITYSSDCNLYLTISCSDLLKIPPQKVPINGFIKIARPSLLGWGKSNQGNKNNYQINTEQLVSFSLLFFLFQFTWLRLLWVRNCQQLKIPKQIQVSVYMHGMICIVEGKFSPLESVPIPLFPCSKSIKKIPSTKMLFQYIHVGYIQVGSSQVPLSRVLTNTIIKIAQFVLSIYSTHNNDNDKQQLSKFVYCTCTLFAYRIGR